MPAVALTDQGNLFALVKFYRAALARGIKPLIGVDALLRDESERVPSRAGSCCCASERRLQEPDAAGVALRISKAARARDSTAAR